MTSSSTAETVLSNGRLVFPMPVAIACGRVLRARTAPERVEACLKAAEVLARYTCALSLASYSAIEETIGRDPLAEMSGSLAFGQFLSTVQQISLRPESHLLSPLLAQGFKKVKRNSSFQPGRTDKALASLLEIRNMVGHQLSGLDEARAISIERDQNPISLLSDALEGLTELLKLPLFIIESQRYTKDHLSCLRLLLMGESTDPLPEEIQVQHQPGGFSEVLTPYVAVRDLALSLPPSILWDVDNSKKRYDLFFVDQVKDNAVRYRTIEGTYHPNALYKPADLLTLLEGSRRQPADQITLASGISLTTEWKSTRQHLVDNFHKSEGRVNWANLDKDALKLFAKLLNRTEEEPVTVVKQQLLNDRDTLDQHELRQLNLLFGIPKVVRTELRRDLMDLRIVDEESGRPTQRELLEADNLLTALGKAVRFLSRDLDLDGGDDVDLTKTEGTFDYIATRELLVNQIVHQDYQDKSAPSQIEVFRTKVSVFNAGYSLLEMPEVLEGGKSQSRNPLIARALRLAGFAEISGSGIRALQRACLKAKRPAPEIKSDRQNNTFTLVVRWGEKQDEVNSYWRSLLGVSLSQEQAEILEAIKNNPSITLSAIESQTRYDTETVVSAIEFLTLQVLIVSDNANYRLADHLQDQLS